VVLTGEATISVAGVDLIYLGLNLVLSSVEALERNQGGATSPRQGMPPRGSAGEATPSQAATSDGWPGR
jgi:hypothetical protein